MKRLREHARREDGQIMLLSIAYGVFVLVLVLVIAAVSHVHIERKKLWALADAMAAHAADAADVDLWYRTGGAGGLVLTDASVQASVQEYLDVAPTSLTGSFRDLGVHSAAVDDDVAEVSLSARVRPPLVPWVLIPWQDGITIQVTSQGQARQP